MMYVSPKQEKILQQAYLEEANNSRKAPLTSNSSDA